MKIDCEITDESVSNIINSAKYLTKLTRINFQGTSSRNIKLTIN